MKRILLLASASILSALPALAQNSTVVTGTITDPSGLPYSNATVQAQLLPTGITPTVPVPCNGQSVTPCVVSPYQRTTADPTGTFSMTLASNAVITPGGTTWQFTVNENGVAPPIGTGPQSCTATVSISGASQSVSTSFSCPALSKTTGNPSTAGLIDPTQGPYNVNPTGGMIGADGSTTNLSPNFSSANASCSPGDVGKAISVVNTGTKAWLIPTATVTTVTGCSGNAWVMSQNATGTLAGTATWAIGWQAGAKLAAAYAATFGSGLNAGKILALPCGVMMLESPPFKAPTYATYSNHPDIQGCNSTMGSVFVFLPTVASGLPTGGAIFADAGSTYSPGSITIQGSGTMTRIEGLTFTSLNGPINGTGGQGYAIISNFFIVNHLFVQQFNTGTGVWNVVNCLAGECRFRDWNIQNSLPSNVVTGLNGQGINGLSDSIIAFNGNGNYPVSCAAATYCVLSNDYFIGNNSAIGAGGAGAVITLVGNYINCGQGAGLGACVNDANNASTWYVFGNPLITMTSANFGAINISNAATAFDMSGSAVSSFTSGYNLTGSGSLNDRAGVTWSSPLTQFGGTYNPIGGGSNAVYKASAATNFGTALGAQTVVGSVNKQFPVTILVSARQVTAGVGCGAGTNTATITVNYTAPGGTAETISPTVLSISANGALDNGATAYQTFQFPAQTGSAITYTVASVLASAGCSTTPQYQVDARTF